MGIQNLKKSIRSRVSKVWKTQKIKRAISQAQDLLSMFNSLKIYAFRQSNLIYKAIEYMQDVIEKVLLPLV